MRTTAPTGCCPAPTAMPSPRPCCGPPPSLRPPCLRTPAAGGSVGGGASRDGTVGRARRLGGRLIGGARGRASQMNAGAGAARGEILLFLHADTRLPQDADRLVTDGLDRSGRAWGRFD